MLLYWISLLSLRLSLTSLCQTLLSNNKKPKRAMCVVVIRRSFEKFMFLVEQAHWYYEVCIATPWHFFAEEDGCIVQEIRGSVCDAGLLQG